MSLKYKFHVVRLFCESCVSVCSVNVRNSSHDLCLYQCCCHDVIVPFYVKLHCRPRKANACLSRSGRVGNVLNNTVVMETRSILNTKTHEAAADVERDITETRVTVYLMTCYHSDSDLSLSLVSQDAVLAELLHSFKDQIVGYHEHDSLLDHKEEEALSEEDRKAAWAEYEAEKKVCERTNTSALFKHLAVCIGFNVHSEELIYCGVMYCTLT